MDPTGKEVRRLMGLDKKNDLSIGSELQPMTQDQPIVSPKSFEAHFKENERVKESYKELWTFNNRTF